MSTSHLIFLAFVLAVPAVLAAAEEANLLPNPTFEKGKADKPDQWKPNTYAGKADLTWEDTGRDDKRCVAVSSAKGTDAAWQVEVKVHRDSVYRLSGWVKTVGVKPTSGRGALLNVHMVSGAETPAVAGTTDWKRVECEFETGSRTQVTINCLFGGWGQATGKALFDDVSLTLVHKGDRKNPSAIVRLDKPAGKINPFIYGQFIEHLGRCIYGGIWAEMLEDRKFANLVTSRHSPWKRMGGEVGWSLTMDVERPHVGNWSAKVSVTGRAPGEPCGIMQDDLGVVADKEYVGRAVLAGEGKVEATLAWGDKKDQRQTVTIDCKGDRFKSYPLTFKAGGVSDAARFSLAVRGKGMVWIGTASLMPADNVNGMRADTLEVLKQLDSPIYRWPGGNFVSGYDWRDGIGPRDRRPPRKNPAWRGIEHNDFGIDEFVAYCRELKTEPLAVVNTGLGSPELAAAMVSYCNGPADSEWGKRRAANGHKEPYNIVWWGVGNEMYGGWQLGHTSLERYAVRHNEFVRAMRAVDPKIKLVAVGASGKWSQHVLTHCAGAMDMLSEHFYCREKPDLEAHVAQIPENVRAKAVAHRRYHREVPALRKRKKMIPIALDEWNYWYGKHLFGELGTRYFLKDALGIARGIHEMVRHNDVFQMANYAQTVNVIGCIKTSKTAAAFATTGLPLMLYRKHFGTTAIEVKGRPVPLDVAAALTDDGKATIAVVNPTKEVAKLKLTVDGGRLAPAARRFVITGSGPKSYNEPGKPLRVKVRESTVADFDPSALELAPASITLYVVAVEK